MIRQTAAALAAIAISLRPDRAAAHAFQAGADIYDQFVEGTAVALAAPEIILVLVPAGLLAGLWRRDGLPALWPYLLCGWGAGLLLAPALPDTTAVASLALGAVIGTVTALQPAPAAPVPHAMAGLAGFAAAAASFQGHGLFELTPGTHAGLFFGANLAVAAVAGAAAASLERWPRPWLRIGWRVAASWTAAIALMLLAFELRPILA